MMIDTLEFITIRRKWKLPGTFHNDIIQITFYLDFVRIQLCNVRCIGGPDTGYIRYGTYGILSSPSFTGFPGGPRQKFVLVFDPRSDAVKHRITLTLLYIIRLAPSTRWSTYVENPRQLLIGGINRLELPLLDFLIVISASPSVWKPWTVWYQQLCTSIFHNSTCCRGKEELKKLR